MLNFRKLKQDFSSSLLKEGQKLFAGKMVKNAKILHLDCDTLKIHGKVKGSYENNYECELEIDRFESEIVDSNCDCPYSYDCQHLAALLFYLEKHLDAIIVSYSKNADLEESEVFDEDEKEQLRETFREAVTKEDTRKGKQLEKEALQEYLSAAKILGSFPFFLPEEQQLEDQAELLIVFSNPQTKKAKCSGLIEFQIALRLPYRSKSLHINHISEFLDGVRYHEPVTISGRRYFFTQRSFDAQSRQLLNMLLSYVRFDDKKSAQRNACVDFEDFGALLAKAYDLALQDEEINGKKRGEKNLPCLYHESIEQPLRFSKMQAGLHFNFEYMHSHTPKLFLIPHIVMDKEYVSLDQGAIFECDKPGMIHKQTYYSFQDRIKRVHLRNLPAVRDMTIPEPLFGSFVENALPELLRFSTLGNQQVIESFVTLPHVQELSAECNIHYLDGELEASLDFIYGDLKVPATDSKLTYSHIRSFVSNEGILARNLSQEQKLLQNLFEGFVHNSETGNFLAKTEKKIVSFMTEVLPLYQNQVQFHCPENLLTQFIYDESKFKLHLRQGKTVACFEAQLEVEGSLMGVRMDVLWECISSKKTYIELGSSTKGAKKQSKNARKSKILVLDLSIVTPLVQLFDEFGIKVLENHVVERPLWSLASIDKNMFKGLPVSFSLSKSLLEIQKQMLGQSPLETSPVPKEIQADLRRYQVEGIQWLERLRKMCLNGILADDMGLGKTLQAIVTLAQVKKENPQAFSLVVCPTSLLYNWEEECLKFLPQLKVLVVDGLPNQRKKILKKINQYDLIITSYSLLQKDVDVYKEQLFTYMILDEGQHIKNKSTLNARSVKLLAANHKVILTGTPVENCLEELWSLFDFLMPGLLSSYDRFVEKYLRNPTPAKGGHLKSLQKKVAPFILRRLKKDVLEDLPPISEFVYRCHLSDSQKQLYQSYAHSAREELSRLVEKEGFENIRIHVLATLTRLKQICCHPAIFSPGDVKQACSAKYDMLMELLQTLIEGKHKTVIFSQYTKMLSIIREELSRRSVRFNYLDGSSKNRMSIVKEFNCDKSISVFLVSLKAGGTGLNLASADTVIHYDLWWNPAVENQATDRVYRIGQKRSVSTYKLVTMGTIEEKILEMQNRKKTLVKDIIHSDDQALSKLSWEDVLELLQA